MKFHENPSSGSRAAPFRKRIDGNDKANSRFSYFLPKDSVTCFVWILGQIVNIPCTALSDLFL